MREIRGWWVRELDLPEPARLAPVCRPSTIARMTERIGEGAVAWGVELAYRVARQNIAALPNLGGGAPQLDTLRLGTESVTLVALAGVFEGELLEEAIPPEAATQVRDFVHRRISLPDQWAAIRQGHAELTHAFMEACRSLVPADEQPDQLELVSRILFTFIDGFADNVGRVYEAEAQKWAESAIVARDEALRLVLADEPVRLPEVENHLRFRIGNRYHLGMVLSRETPGAWDSALEDAARAAFTALGVEQTLLVSHGHAELWAWGNGTHPLSAGAEAVLPPGVLAAAGDSAPGLAGFRATHRQAIEARRVSSLLSEPRRLTRFADVRLLALLSGRPEEARSFALAELGDLAGESGGTAELRRTVATFLETHSPQATANRMYLARNTVTYRLKRAEDLLGHALSERQLELWTALRLMDAFGRPQE